MPKVVLDEDAEALETMAIALRHNAKRYDTRVAKVRTGLNRNVDADAVKRWQDRAALLRRLATLVTSYHD